MKRLLHLLSIVLSFLSALFSKADELHHARFARPHELTSLLTHNLDEEGLLLGVSHLGGIYRVKATKERRELGNLLVEAPTRGGKGLLAVSQLLTWPHSVVVNDIKGDLYEQTAGYRQRLGPVFRLDTRGFGHRYDPLRGKVEGDELYDVAKHLLYEPAEGDGKAFTQRATKMLTLLWLAARHLNHMSGEEQTRLLPFTGLMADLGLNRAAAVVNAISPTIARRLLDGDYTPVQDYDERKYLASSWESLTARLYPLLTEKVVRCFAGSDFTGEGIIKGVKPVTVYLCWSEAAILGKAALIRLIWESLIAEMLATFDEASGRDCRPVLLLMDEAGTVGIPSLPQYAATVAGRGISLWAAYQDPAQMDGLYGTHKAKTIRNNMDTKIFYRQASHETARFVEGALGYRSGYAHSQTLRQGQEASESLGEQAVPLLTARDISELGHDEILVFHSNRKPFRGKRMDWREFPMLVKRRSLPAPTLSPLPQLSEILLPALRAQGPSPLQVLDPDAMN